MVYYGLLWYIMINYDKLWYIMVYYGILWYIMAPKSQNWADINRSVWYNAVRDFCDLFHNKSRQ